MSSNVSRQESPLSRLLEDDTLTIMETILPYCRPHLAKLLAVQMKILEIQKIMSGFDDEPRLRACGFEEPSADVESVLRSLRNSVSEEKAQQIYADLYAEVPEAAAIRADEEHHEAALLELLDEERLHYVGSMVLGLNDALVELTGTLAGLTFAMQNNRLVALSGLITGASATLSMASSEYLSARSEGKQDALKSSVYTGIAYLLTVALLVLPYLLLPAAAWLASLGILLATVVLIIAGFTYYVSVAQGLSFRRRFGEMAAISLGVAVISFVIGLLVKQFLGIDL